MSHRVVHFEVVGNDGDRLERFYREAFDWRMEAAAPGYVMAKPGGEGGINGGIGGGHGESRVTFYVETDDLGATLSKIDFLGGTTVMEPTDLPGGTSIAMFADPEGHVIGLVQAGPPASE